ncbi:MAG: pyridoxamine 5'-phosphate oxidase family protein, partial [Candidatus Eisenbacteria bacterium]|nr:pyridoxamine 5'-phosphate oxidase family protein [Candidatus Eisenbacteria bacterium]
MYQVRRKEREIQEPDELRRIVREGRFATLALCREGEPYLVTLSHGYDQIRHCLYFHASPEGQKLDFIRVNPRACATVVEDHGYVT